MGNFEAILVHQGGHDDDLKICKKYVEMDQRFSKSTNEFFERKQAILEGSIASYISNGMTESGMEESYSGYWHVEEYVPQKQSRHMFKRGLLNIAASWIRST